METRAAIENVKIGQKIKAIRTGGGHNEGYYLGTADFIIDEKRVDEAVVIGLRNMRFEEVSEPFRITEIPFSPLSMRGSSITDIEIIEGDSLVPAECFALLTEGGYGAFIPEALWAIVDETETSHG